MTIKKETFKKKRRASFSSLMKKTEEKENKDAVPAYEEVNEDQTSEHSKAPEKLQEEIIEHVEKKKKEEKKEASDAFRSAPLMVVEKETVEKQEKKEQVEDKSKEIKKEPKDTIEQKIADFAPLESQPQADVDEVEQAPRKSILILIIIAIISFIFGLLVALGVGKVMQMQQSSQTPEATEAPTSKPTISVTPSPEPTVSREDIILEVLNGSGIRGAASQARNFLEELGYTVNSVGNADKSSYSESQLIVNEDMDEAIIELLLNDIGDEYTVATPSSELEEDVEVTARFIVGKE